VGVALNRSAHHSKADDVLQVGATDDAQLGFGIGEALQVSQ
jgi:hypothetical protein